MEELSSVLILNYSDTNKLTSKEDSSSTKKKSDKKLKGNKSIEQQQLSECNEFILIAAGQLGILHMFKIEIPNQATSSSSLLSSSSSSSLDITCTPLHKLNILKSISNINEELIASSYLHAVVQLHYLPDLSQIVVMTSDYNIITYEM
jgi:hypothetical protein